MAKKRATKASAKTELRKLLRAARGHLRDFAMLELLAGTGLRVGEVLALKAGDVEINDRSGKVIVRRGKHGGYWEIPLTLDVR
jgi:integrase/recombinase XerD